MGKRSWWRVAAALVPHPVIAVWVVWAVSLGSLWYDSIGPVNWLVAGHEVAGDRYFFILGILPWVISIRLCGRRSDEEITRYRWAFWSFVLAAATAWISFERMSLGWYAFHVPLGVAQAMVVGQLWAWSRAGKIERIGVLVLTAGASVELLVYALVQSMGWDPACIYGLGLTCREGALATAVVPASEATALAVWCLWLVWKISRGGG